jgi:dTDP-4-dehydrorhamnose reductase
MGPILVVGGTGMLGSTLVPVLRTLGPVVVHGRSAQRDANADFADPAQARALLDRVRPATVVNLAGLTNVDTCEQQPHQAYLLNVKVVESIVAWMQGRDASPALVHVSTDQVYDGTGPHREDAVTLTNTYALTKYAGELAALRVPATVLRTNFFGPSRCAARTSFTDWLLRALRQGQALQVFDDVLFGPLSMTTLTQCIAHAVQQPVAGVYNLGASTGMSKADFSFAFAEAMRLPTGSMRRTTTGQVDFLKTYRPKDMRMDNTAFEAAFQRPQPTLAAELQLVCEEYLNEPAPARA